ncbi:hypothetical protein JYK14_06165 [Siccirubricoccus sp. KC 17139]|uniref:Dienelactone hydrolase domain-containing protein n=1 Tax=Siccirubricoccus soli TaxID=2899147 RepID=A0ABT1D1H3_9PROT|nr:hypothetical protein [Siccirubricoccus soli]MCO6415764.1 hypothetical protein [Siccirubricoccus soli]MCP2681896.1 hypothetical protein [Siccirubricoccus soli]
MQGGRNRGPAGALALLFGLGAAILAATAWAEPVPDGLGSSEMLLPAEGLVGLLSLPPWPGQGLPAVLVLHDALGPDARSSAYIDQLLGARIAVLDLLTEAPGEAARDAALAAIALDGRIDAGRLGVLGFGAGAAAALTAPVMARALLYPGCASLPHPAALAGAVLLAHGGADPANPAAACRRLAAALEGAGARVRRLDYAQASYGWDRPPSMPGEIVLLPAPGLAERVAARPWPALTTLAAAQVAGFFALALRP